MIYDANDERITVHYGDPATATTARGWESFAPFNDVADTVEWRLDARGKPFAAIQRFLISTGDEMPGSAKAQVKGQVLVISKIGQPQEASGCVAGLVDALSNVDANDLARRIADDLAPGFACGRDKAVYHGKRGDKAADFNAYFNR